MLSVLLLSGVLTFAQLTVKVGDTTELSVKEVSNETYLWELYDTAKGVDFAVTSGNCPKDKAIFIGGKNTGSVVNVKWLTEGEYFYKVTVQNSCTNNIKIGRVVVGKADIPPMPQVTVSYDCDTGTATLTASNYQGELLWSTGEKTESIVVSEEGEYSVVQLFNKQKSEKAVAIVSNLKAEKPQDVKAIPPIIEKGENSELFAKGCEWGHLRWFLDKKLTKEIFDTRVNPEKTTTYYVLCQTDNGCQSKVDSVRLRVIDGLACKDFYKKLKIEQLVTPNGDGYNDVWELEDVLKYCKECNKSVTVKIFNRRGAKVYEKQGYMLDEERFDGESQNALDFINKEKLPSGTYFYLILVNGEKGKTGFINLIVEDK